MMPVAGRGRTAVLVTSLPGSVSRRELERQVAARERHRKDYLEVARRLGADVIDHDFVTRNGSRLSRLLVKHIGVPIGQVAEAFRRRREYRHVLAWSDRLGLPLALLYKLTRFDGDLVLLSVDVSAPQKARFLRWFKVHTHLRAIITPSSRQVALAEQLGVPSAKVFLDPHGVDTQFWRPGGERVEDLICTVGWEARDYPTLVEAVRGLDVHVEAAVGTMVFSGGEVARDRLDTAERHVPPDLTPLKGTQGYRLYQRSVAELERRHPSNVVWRQQLSARELRTLYARSRFVIIPLYDVEFDAGATAILEAMAMGKAIVLTRARGQTELVRDGKDGLYVPAGDPAALRAACEYLLAHPDKADRMGRMARARAESVFSLDDYAVRVASVVGGG
jgi:glycosyltransferase involved in cell wall biosynthesis